MGRPISIPKIASSRGVISTPTHTAHPWTQQTQYPKQHQNQ